MVQRCSKQNRILYWCYVIRHRFATKVSTDLFSTGAKGEDKHGNRRSHACLKNSDGNIATEEVVDGPQEHRK